MTRYIGNTVVLAKPETVVGTDSVPTGAADAVLVTQASITPVEAKMINRDFLRSYYGASEQQVGSVFKKCSYTVEMGGSGAAGTAPQWGDLLVGCGFAEAVLATPDRVEYTPYTPSSAAPLETLSHYYYDDGVFHKMLGSAGGAKLSAKINERPTLAFDMMGLDGGDTAASNPATTLTAWKTPPVITKASVVDITLGCTYSAGAISGGTVYPSQGIEIDFGTKMDYVDQLSAQRVDMMDRQVSGSMQLELTAAQLVALLAIVRAGTAQSLAITLGLTAGNKIIIYCPAVQLAPPAQQAIGSVRAHSFGLRMLPLVGNDEVRIVCQ